MKTDAAVIKCDFTPHFRTKVLDAIMQLGAFRTRMAMLDHGYHPSFVDTLIRRLRAGAGNG